MADTPHPGGIFFPTSVTSGWTTEQWADFRRVSLEDEEPCIQCGRVILAGCTDPKCGQAK